MEGAGPFLRLPKTRYLRQVAKAELKFKFFSSALLSFPLEGSTYQAGDLCVTRWRSLYYCPFFKKKKKEQGVRSGGLPQELKVCY